MSSIITRVEIANAEKVLNRLGETVREDLETKNELVAKFEMHYNWDAARCFGDRLAGAICMLWTLGMITEDEQDLLNRYFIVKVVDLKNEMEVA